MSFPNNKNRTVFAFLFVLSITPFFWKFLDKAPVTTPKNELFKPELYYLNSLEKVRHYTDSIYDLDHATLFDTAKYVQIVSTFTKEKFYHGLSTYELKDNWIAFLAGKLFWKDLLAIVDPDEILKHPEGLCSQQTIVFMELLKNKGIHTRNVGLGYKEGPGHYLSEVQYNGSWHIYDVTMEPLWTKVTNSHKSVEYYLTCKDSLYSVYEARYDKPLFYKLIGNITYGKEDTFPARHMLLFHRISSSLTYIIPLAFMYMFILASGKKRKNFEGNEEEDHKQKQDIPVYNEEKVVVNI